MKVAIPRETGPGERRVALVPELVPRLLDAGLEVLIEPGAGDHAHFDDESYKSSGAKVGDIAGADLLVSVQPPPPETIDRLAPDGAIIAMTAPADTRDRMAFAMDRVPRISRAQSMDALSSQAMVSGYQSALIAAERLPRFFPLLMTAAGTVPPARVLVLGAGVAGLQAIATVRRLGAIVSAYDVRDAARDEVKSVGAKFVDLDLPTLEGSGGYAREMTEDRAKLQMELLAPHVADADALVTTAAVPGRTAPRLVTREMVEAMRPGSVVVDMAAEQGGNVEGSVAGEELTVGRRILLHGAQNLPSRLPGQASRLYAGNVAALIQLIIEVGKDADDEILKGCRI